MCPAISPDNKKIAVIDSRVKEKNDLLSYIDLDNANINHIAKNVKILPTFCWGERSIYYIQQNEHNNSFLSFDIKNNNKKVLFNFNELKIDYMFPRLVGGGISLFYGESFEEEPIIGTIDIFLW